MALTLIGYWHPGDTGSGPWPEVSRFVDPTWSADERDAVIDWLDAGIKVRQYLGYSYCRLCKVRNGSTMVSDGVFIWPEGLSHYLREHEVRLPTRVVARALERPKLHEPRIKAVAEESEVDVEWWRNHQPS